MCATLLQYTNDNRGCWHQLYWLTEHYGTILHGRYIHRYLLSWKHKCHSIYTKHFVILSKCKLNTSMRGLFCQPPVILEALSCSVSFCVLKVICKFVQRKGFGTMVLLWELLLLPTECPQWQWRFKQCAQRACPSKDCFICEFCCGSECHGDIMTENWCTETDSKASGGPHPHRPLIKTEANKRRKVADIQNHRQQHAVPKRNVSTQRDTRSAFSLNKNACKCQTAFNSCPVYFEYADLHWKKVMPEH